MIAPSQGDELSLREETYLHQPLTVRCQVPGEGFVEGSDDLVEPNTAQLYQRFLAAR